MSQATADATQLGLDFGALSQGSATDAPTVPANAKWVQLGSERVAYQLKRSKRRTIGFSIGAEGLAVAAPRWALMIEIEAALKSKQHWIIEKLAEWQARKSKLLAHPQRWEHNATLPYLGSTIRLHLGSGIRSTQLQQGLFAEQTLLLALPEDASTEQIKDTTNSWLQSEAKRIFAERIPHYEAKLGVQVTGWRLSNASGRWGSASSNGQVRLHWRLIHFSSDVIDYVIAHELAHLREMNHSPKFWEVVESVLPDFSAARERLKNVPLSVLVQTA